MSVIPRDDIKKEKVWWLIKIDVGKRCRNEKRQRQQSGHGHWCTARPSLPHWLGRQIYQSRNKKSPAIVFHLVGSWTQADHRSCLTFDVWVKHTQIYTFTCWWSSLKCRCVFVMRKPRGVASAISRKPLDEWSASEYTCETRLLRKSRTK